ncbi:MAG: hypothetical protein R2851_01930 [Caldilineaceae bacterium]
MRNPIGREGRWWWKSGERGWPSSWKSLALDAELYAERPMEPDQTLTLAVADVDLPQLEARFRLA